MTTLAAWRPSQTNLIYTVLNGLVFNISWFAIVSTHSATLAPVIAGSHLILHLLLMGRGRPEVLFIVAVTSFGALLDQTLFYFGVFTIDGQPALAPLWITCLWPVVATTCMHAFSGLSKRLWLAVACGGIGGAGSYIAGTSLSDVSFGSVFWGPWIMGGIWLGLFPVLLLVASKFESWGEQHADK